MGFFIPEAMAAVSGSADVAAQQPGGLSMMAMPLLFLVIFYFLFWRPQSKRAKEQREMIGGIKKGDEIVTTGGMLCQVTDINDKFLSAVIAEGIVIKLQKGAVNGVLPKGTIKSV